MTLDLAEYFERIGYFGTAAPTIDVLQDLITAHTGAIAFENLDPLLGVPVDDLGPEALVDKLVRRRRGGYCYEQNGLMGYVLQELGYGVRRFAARVVWMQESGSPVPPQTHTLLGVAPPGAPQLFLVDVGFGGQTPTSPLRLETGTIQQTTHEPYRLQSRGDTLVLQAEIRGEWQSLYEFATRTAPPIDLLVGSWYVSTHPDSHFVTNVMASLVTTDGRVNLSAAQIAVHGRSGTEKIDLPNAAAAVDALRDRFGINVADTGDRAVLEARITELAAR
ncbi:arylamine N-acetyltransferase family protein [Mycobacterium paraterrae]|uniref:Arylamine N-acetyltransferase n=1 Tax=Mycobacterium paraterrae TaxID=577492 RepID=A0ABY3VLB3_9MYCO|nr:arylamine N-acetyltransferase [Mycobacterium paraterrae]UMB70215.1 arylamine N-acetyltransferase [Mycobacterium paraterrae]